MKQFKYDVVKLIQAVRDRPCLWDRTIENYKDRVERKSAWVEIFNILDERYEEKSLDEQRVASEKVLTKWTNIRDTFVKSLKNKSGRMKRQYILHEHLKFLLKLSPESEHQEQDNLGYNDEQDQSTFRSEEPQVEARPLTHDELRKSMEYEIRYEDSEISEVEVTPIFEGSSRRKRKKKNSEEEPNIDFVSIDDPRIMNEDEAFFASLLPTVVKYDEDERLEFRIEVLALMKKIKDKRKWASDDIGQ